MTTTTHKLVDHGSWGESGGGKSGAGFSCKVHARSAIVTIQKVLTTWLPSGPGIS